MQPIAKVLLVDDDLELLDLLTNHFKEQNIEVVKSNYTTNIFALISECDPSVIVLDYLIYGFDKIGINGGEICHQIKTNPLTKHIPVMILSAYDRIIHSLGNYGCDRFVAKPFDIIHLTNTIVHLAGSQYGNDVIDTETR